MTSPLRIISVGYERSFLDAESEASKRLERSVSAEYPTSAIVLSSGSEAKRVFLNGRAFRFSGNAIVRVWKAIRTVLSEASVARTSGETVLISAQDPFAAGFVAFIASRFADIPYEIQEHGDVFSGYWERESISHRLAVLFASFVLHRADGIRVVSDRIKKELVRRFAIPPEHIFVRPVEQDLSWHLQERDRRSETGDQRATIVMPCRFVKQKGIEVALLALKDVASRGIRVQLRLIGSGPLESRIRGLVSELGLTDCVTIEPWAPQESIWENADLFVLSSYYEGWGRTIVEAMAARVPIVTTDVGCVGALFRPQVDGRVVPIGSIEALTNAIAEQLTEVDRRDWMVDQAFTRAKDFVSHQHEGMDEQRNAWRLACSPKLPSEGRRSDLQTYRPTDLRTSPLDLQTSPSDLRIYSRSAWKWTALLIGLVILLRGFSVLLFWKSLGPNREWGFFTLVRSWFEGRGYTFANELGCASAYRSPGFLFFLTGVYLIFGFENFFAQAIVQNIIAVILVYLVYRLAWRVSDDRRVGWIAGAIAALHPYTFYHYTQYYHTVISATLIVGLLLSLLRLERTKHWKDAVLAGVLTASLAYIQGTILPIMPFLSLWLFWQWKWVWRQTIISVSIIACVSAGLIAPWTIRNWHVFHRLVPLTTDMGFGLYKANSENIYALTKLGYPQEVVGTEEVNPTDSLQVKYHLYPEAEEALRTSGSYRDSRFWTEWHPREPIARGDISCSELSSMSEPEVSAHWSAIAKEWLRQNYRWEGVKLQMLKFATFWSPSLQPSIKYGAAWSFGNDGLIATLVRLALVVYMSFILIFGAVGTWIFIRQKRFGNIVPFFLIFVGYTLLHTFFAGYTKYRVPLDGLVAILASVAVVVIWDIWMKKREERSEK
jgi:glycosyltransferase involved in cell wall biosynthesis/4-amino-4-deoxy-L-arabinose transferase-like glycosyltransferase